MLVLTHRLDQTIMIGDDVKVTLVEVRGDQVRVGIDAPRALAVDRKEIWQQKQEEKQAGASGGEARL